MAEADHPSVSRLALPSGAADRVRAGGKSVLLPAGTVDKLGGVATVAEMMSLTPMGTVPVDLQPLLPPSHPFGPNRTVFRAR